MAAVTSAFGDPTRRDIYLFTRESEGVTAGQVASHFDLHPNVARHHLDKLAAGGYLEVYVERSGSGGAGRPSKRYRASAKDMALEFPARRDDLLVLLLGRAPSLLSSEEAECMAETVGEEYGAALAAQMAPGEGQRSLRAAIRTVADTLTAQLATLDYSPADVGVGHQRQLSQSTRKVLALEHQQPGLVVLPAHDPTAAQRLLDS